jgi:hypothetical protein
MPPHGQHISGELRNQLIDVCRASGADLNQAVQALVDTFMIAVIATAPDADAAERNLRNITNDMLNQIHQSYAQYHAMLAAQRHTRQ